MPLGNSSWWNARVSPAGHGLGQNVVFPPLQTVGKYTVGKTLMHVGNAHLSLSALLLLLVVVLVVEYGNPHG